MMNQEAAMICDDKVLEKSHASRVRKFIYFTAGMAGLLFGLDQGSSPGRCLLLRLNGASTAPLKNG